MKVRYLANAFSLSMLPMAGSIEIKVIRLSEADAKDRLIGFYSDETGGYTPWPPHRGAQPELRAVSCVGHADTAAVLTSVLGTEVPANRIGVKLNADDELVVAQYNGPRLPEGTTSLPEGASFSWLLVKIVPTGAVPVGCPDFSAYTRAEIAKYYNDIQKWVSSADDPAEAEYYRLEAARALRALNERT